MYAYNEQSTRDWITSIILSFDFHLWTSGMSNKARRNASTYRTWAQALDITFWCRMVAFSMVGKKTTCIIFYKDRVQEQKLLILKFKLLVLKHFRQDQKMLLYFWGRVIINIHVIFYFIKMNHFFWRSVSFTYVYSKCTCF